MSFASDLLGANTVSTTSPSARTINLVPGQEAAFGNYFNRVNQRINQAGNLQGRQVLGFNPTETGAHQSIINLGQGQVPQLAQQGIDSLQPSLQGTSSAELARVIAAAIDPVREQLTQQILPGITQSFGGAAGQRGAGRGDAFQLSALGNFGDTAGDIASQISYTDFDRAKQRQIAAAGLVPTLNQELLRGPQAVADVGAAERELAQQQADAAFQNQTLDLEELAALQGLLGDQIATGYTSSGGTQTNEEQGNTLEAILGGLGLWDTFINSSLGGDILRSLGLENLIPATAGPTATPPTATPPPATPPPSNPPTNPPSNIPGLDPAVDLSSLSLSGGATGAAAGATQAGLDLGLSNSAANALGGPLGVGSGSPAAGGGVSGAIVDQGLSTIGAGFAPGSAAVGIGNLGTLAGGNVGPLAGGGFSALGPTGGAAAGGASGTGGAGLGGLGVGAGIVGAMAGMHALQVAGRYPQPTQQATTADGQVGMLVPVGPPGVRNIISLVGEEVQTLQQGKMTVYRVIEGPRVGDYYDPKRAQFISPSQTLRGLGIDIPDIINIAERNMSSSEEATGRDVGLAGLAAAIAPHITLSQSQIDHGNSATTIASNLIHALNPRAEDTR